MRRISAWLCAAAAAGLMSAAATAAQAAEPLAWSFASTGVGHCTSGTFNCQTGPGGALTYDDQHYEYDFGVNASSSSANAAYGAAHGSAGPGVGSLALPELHADVSGTTGGPGGYSWNYTQTQGVQGFVWGAGAIDIPISAFQAILDFTISNAGYGEASASLAILTSAIEDRAVGDLWYPADMAGYGFLAGCSTAGAIGVGETGAVSGAGIHSITVAPGCAGQSAFHLETGDRFYLWARLSTFHLGDGFTDASHTFSVNLSPDLAPEMALLLTQNLTPTGPLDLGSSAPEPATWAMLIAGFGMAGAALRRRRILVEA